MNKNMELGHRLVKQLDVLAGEGWPGPACHVYRCNLQRSPRTHRLLNTTFHQAHLVGSSLYMRMLEASQLTARQRLSLILDRHLGARVEWTGFLQLTSHDYQLDPTISPLAPFYAEFRQLVRDAYPGTAGLRADELGHRLHLFRAYLDHQAITYVRAYTDGLPDEACDLDRLYQFAHDHHVALDFQTAAAYHNRQHGPAVYPRNMKVQLRRNSYARRVNPARMIEFIVDIDSGDFVSEWNVYRSQPNGRVDADPHHYTAADLYQVANTESFNYGIPHGGYFVWPRDRQSHRRLDIDQPTDSRIRARAKGCWKTPHLYADLVKGPRDVLAWRRVPASVRTQLYAAFVHDTQTHRNQGINYFLLKSPRYRCYHVGRGCDKMRPS